MRPKLLLEDASDDVVERVREQVLDRSTEELVEALEVIRDRADRSDTLAGFAGPALVAVGESDTFFPPDEAQQLAHAALHGRFRAFAGARHLPNLEQPDEFNAALDGLPRRCLSCRRSSTRPGCRSTWARTTSCSATCGAQTRTSAGTCPARSRSCSARRRRWRRARPCRSSRSRCSGASAATGSPAQERLVLYDRGDCVGAAASQQAALVAGHPQVSVLAGGVAAWPGELEQGAVELQKTKTELEPRLEAVPTWEELRDRLDDPG